MHNRSEFSATCCAQCTWSWQMWTETLRRRERRSTPRGRPYQPWNIKSLTYLIFQSITYIDINTSYVKYTIFWVHYFSCLIYFRKLPKCLDLTVINRRRHNKLHQPFESSSTLQMDPSILIWSSKGLNALATTFPISKEQWKANIFYKMFFDA